MPWPQSAFLRTASCVLTVSYLFCFRFHVPVFAILYRKAYTADDDS